MKSDPPAWLVVMVYSPSSRWIQLPPPSPLPASVISGVWPRMALSWNSHRRHGPVATTFTM